MSEEEKIELIGKYIVLSEIAQGGMSIVYKGVAISENRPVVIKRYCRLNSKDMVRLRNVTELADKYNSKQEFYKEVSILTKLSHPNLVKVLDHFIPDSGPFLNDPCIVMEYLEGKTLAQILSEEKLLSYKRTRQYMLPIMSAVEYCHKHLVIHGDIKPENIIIDKVNHPILIDFSVSVDLQRIDSGFRGISEKYSPPEIRVNRKLTPTSDIYSLTATIYTLLTGKEPPDPFTNLSVPLKMRMEKSGIPPSLDLLIVKGMQQDSSKRYSRISDLKKALQPYSISNVIESLRDPVKRLIIERGVIPISHKTSNVQKMVAGRDNDLLLVYADGTIQYFSDPIRHKDETFMTKLLEWDGRIILDIQENLQGKAKQWSILSRKNGKQESRQLDTIVVSGQIEIAAPQKVPNWVSCFCFKKDQFYAAGKLNNKEDKEKIGVFRINLKGCRRDSTIGYHETNGSPDDLAIFCNNDSFYLCELFGQKFSVFVVQAHQCDQKYSDNHGSRFCASHNNLVFLRYTNGNGENGFSVLTPNSENNFERCNQIRITESFEQMAVSPDYRFLLANNKIYWLSRKYASLWRKIQLRNIK